MPPKLGKLATFVEEEDGDEEEELEEPVEDLAQLEAELEGIDAEFFKAQEFDPLPHVLSAVSARDPHEQELAYRALQSQKASVDSAVARVVRSRHESLKSGVSNFGRIRKGLAASQTRLRDVRRGVTDTRNMLLQPNRRELRELYFDYVQSQQMVAMLTRIDKLVGVPAEVEGCMERKQYVRAVKLFNSALEMMFAPDLLPVEALSNVRDALLVQKQTIEETVVDELSSHLYAHAKSKAFFTEYRWAVADVLSSGAADELVRLLGHDAAAEAAVAASESPVDDPDSGSDPTTFIRASVEALSQLGRLAEAANGLLDRLEADLTAVLHAQLAFLTAHAEPGTVGGQRLCQLIVLAAAAFVQVTHHHNIFLQAAAEHQPGFEPYQPDDVWEIAAYLLLQVLRPHVQQPPTPSPNSPPMVLRAAQLGAVGGSAPAVVMSGLFRFSKARAESERQEDSSSSSSSRRPSVGPGGLGQSAVIGGVDCRVCDPSPLLLLDVYIPLGRVVPAMARLTGVSEARTNALSNLLRSMVETELIPVLAQDTTAIMDAISRQPDLHLRDRRERPEDSARGARSAWAEAEASAAAAEHDYLGEVGEVAAAGEEGDEEEDEVPSLAASRVVDELRRLVGLRRFVPDQDDEALRLVRALLDRFTRTCASQLTDQTAGTAGAALHTPSRKELQQRQWRVWRDEQADAEGAALRLMRSRQRTASGFANDMLENPGSAADGAEGGEGGPDHEVYRQERAENRAAFLGVLSGAVDAIDLEQLLRARQGLSVLPAVGRSCRQVARCCAQLAATTGLPEPLAAVLRQCQADLLDLALASLQKLAMELNVHAVVYLGQLPRAPDGAPDLSELASAVHRFNKEVLVTEEAVRPYLPASHADYLFASLARCVTWLLEHLLVGFEGDRQFGDAHVAALRAAAFSLQYNMLSAVPTAPLRRWFERARRFFQLIGLTADEQVAFAGDAFDAEELELLRVVSH